MDNGNGELIQGKGTGTEDGKEGQIVRGASGFDGGAGGGFDVDLALLNPVKTGWFFENRKNCEWLSTKEAAHFLSITENALRILVHRGQIPVFKFGRRLRFKQSDCQALFHRKGA